MKPIVLDESYKPLSQFLGNYLNQNMGDATWWKPGEKKTEQAAIAYAVRTNRLKKVDEWISLLDAFLHEPYDDEQLEYILDQDFNVGIAPPPGVSIRTWLSELLQVAERERSLKLS